MEKYLQRIAEHANGEETAARTYDQLSAWCGIRIWPGCEKFFAGEADDERRHAREWRQYAVDRGIMPILEPQSVAVPEVKDWIDPLNLLKAFQEALLLERAVLQQINELAAAAAASSDYEAVHWMAPYLEVGRRSIRDLEVKCSTLARAGSDWCALQAFDRELAG